MLLDALPGGFSPDLQGGRMVERLARSASYVPGARYRSTVLLRNLGEKGMEAFKAGTIGKSAAVSLAGIPRRNRMYRWRKEKLTDTEIREYKKGKTARRMQRRKQNAGRDGDA